MPASNAFARSTSKKSVRTNLVRTIGFARSNSDDSSAVVAPSASNAPSPKPIAEFQRPTPRKRAKGRLFISLVLFTIFGSLGLALWNEFFRYQAYGVLEGKVVRVSTPWSGFIEQLSVEDGDYVEKGELLARLKNEDLQLRLAKTEDEIRLARAAMTTRLAELQMRDRELSLEFLRSHVDYFQILSNLHSERIRLAELSSLQEVYGRLEGDRVIPRLEREQTATARDGQASRVASLEEAALKLQQGLASIEKNSMEHPLLEADRARLETLTAEWERLQAFLMLGEIRAPVSGRIVRSDRWKGEFVEAHAELFEVLEEGSLQAVLYVRQSQAMSFRPGEQIDLSVPPNRKLAPFVIERLDDQASVAPTNLSRFYRREERLVTVIATPLDRDYGDTQTNKSVWLGGQVCLPRSFGKIPWKSRDAQLIVAH